MFPALYFGLVICWKPTMNCEVGRRRANTPLDVETRPALLASMQAAKDGPAPLRLLLATLVKDLCNVK